MLFGRIEIKFETTAGIAEPDLDVAADELDSLQDDLQELLPQLLVKYPALSQLRSAFSST